jgi:hypothetical protein
MGVDFVLDQGCRVKEKLGTEGLVNLVKSRSRAEAILAMARRKGDTKPPSEIRITVAVVTPEGTREGRSVSVQSMLDQAAPLNDLAPHCKTCPANLDGPSFGCYGSIHYPIQARTEQWLMGLLPDDLETTAGFVLQKAVKDLKYDGSPIERLRTQPTFFESRSAARRTWKAKGFFGRISGGFSLTSSQVLQMMFSLGPLQPSHCGMVSLFLGLIPHDSPGQAIKDKAIFEKAAGDIRSRIQAPADVAGASNFFHLFQAMVGAVVLDVPVLVDG